MESIALKLDRAAEHLKAIQDAIAKDADTRGNRIIVESKGKETLYLPIPHERLAILIGEFLYQIRSALDHLAFDLVQLNRGNSTLPAEWEESCTFPTWSVLKPGQTPPLPYGVFKNLPGIPKEAHTIIERVQPYYPTGSVNTSLLFLVALSNIDKHRHLTFMRRRGKVFHDVIYGSGHRSSSMVTLDHGAEVPTPYVREGDSIVSMERSTTLTIAFDEWDALGDASIVAIDQLLETILTDVLLNVVNPLTPFCT